MPHILTFIQLDGEMEHRRQWTADASELSAGRSATKFDKSHHSDAAAIQL